MEKLEMGRIGGVPLSGELPFLRGDWCGNLRGIVEVSMEIESQEGDGEEGVGGAVGSVGQRGERGAERTTSSHNVGRDRRRCSRGRNCVPRGRFDGVVRGSCARANPLYNLLVVLFRVDPGIDRVLTLRPPFYSTCTSSLEILRCGDRVLRAVRIGL